MTAKNEQITLPDYKTPPPYGGTVLQWWGFFLGPHRVTAALCLLTNLVRRTFFGMQPFFVGLLVGWVESGAILRNPWLGIGWMALYGAASLVMFLALYPVIVPAWRAMDKTSKEISLFAFRHYLSLSESWHENRASGEKLQRILTARQTSFALMNDTLWDVLQIATMLIAVTLSVVLLQAPFYFVILFFVMIISYIGLSFLTGNWMIRRYKEFYKTQEDVVGGVYEFLISTSTLRLFGLKDHIMGKSGALEAVNHESRMKIARVVFYRWLLMDNVALVCILGIIGLALYGVLHGTLSIAAFTTIAFLTITIWSQLESFAMIYTKLVEYWEGFKRLTEILNIQPAITDSPGARDLHAPDPAITFRNVEFGYHEGQAVVENLSLSIRAGEKIGLIGPSGAGKSTVVKLLLRFYEADEGAIEIGGQDIREVTQHSLQSHIAVIPQDAVLFNHPLMENIRYGRLDASDAEVMEAARQAHAHEFIEKLPQGYATPVGERGVKLSGGQRQRIAIARAILKNAPILVLDEATSALDSESEKLIQDSLKQIMRRKTVIAIAHRLSTIATLDRLIVMNEGRIVESGSHKELLAKKGLYAKLWAMQSGGFIPV